MFRGTTTSGKDIEMQILKFLPGVAIFVEKPVATGPVTDIQDAFEVSKFIAASGVPCSVGLVFLLLLPAGTAQTIISDTCCDTWKQSRR